MKCFFLFCNVTIYSKSAEKHFYQSSFNQEVQAKVACIHAYYVLKKGRCSSDIVLMDYEMLIRISLQQQNKKKFIVLNLTAE